MYNSLSACQLIVLLLWLFFSVYENILQQGGFAHPAPECCFKYFNSASLAIKQNNFQSSSLTCYNSWTFMISFCFVIKCEVKGCHEGQGRHHLVYLACWARMPGIQGFRKIGHLDLTDVILLCCIIRSVAANKLL